MISLYTMISLIRTIQISYMWAWCRAAALLLLHIPLRTYGRSSCMRKPGKRGHYFSTYMNGTMMSFHEAVLTSFPDDPAFALPAHTHIVLPRDMCKRGSPRAAQRNRVARNARKPLRETEHTQAHRPSEHTQYSTNTVPRLLCIGKAAGRRN